ncbi:NeuD/PglB/VioB family sugar acetyltransferase [Bradyrhizobium sp.]|uniref:NeuD/PglB/VioB family sugar acetyltransferase n=1 Tax=Bradyrhizobium sp. TaxID=376 RepID=UPI0039E6F958
MRGGAGLVILGFGGHARSVASIALSSGFEALLFVDENARPGETFLGFPAVTALEGRDFPDGWVCIPAIGDNCSRERQYELATAAGWPLGNVIAETATIASDAEMSTGCFVGHHAHVGPSARVGAGCIVNTGGIVEHECVVGDFCHVSVNAVLAGRSKLGMRVFLGAGASVIDGIAVSGDITIGAGAVVIESLTERGRYVGCPARRLND